MYRACRVEARDGGGRKITAKRVGGYMGKILRADFDREQLTEESLDNETLRKHIGGNGLEIKYLYEEVPPKSNSSGCSKKE